MAQNFRVDSVFVPLAASITTTDAIVLGMDSLNSMNLTLGRWTEPIGYRDPRRNPAHVQKNRN